MVRRNARGQITFANRSYQRMFGLEGQDLAGRVHEPRVLEIERAAAGNPDATQPAPQGRTRACVETVNGPRWIEWDEVTFGTPGSAERETQCNGRDITQEREAAEALRAARDAALEASRAKSRFLATMSHEIRTPMNGILGISGLMIETKLDDEQSTYAGAIRQSARALMRLIDEILDFSKIEAGKLVLDARPFRIIDTIENCLALLTPRAMEKGLDMSWQLDGDPPPQLVGDEARVRQVVLNLLSNAVKFTDAGHIRLTLRTVPQPGKPTSARINIAIADTGIGLSQADQKSLFAEFEQSEEAVRRQDGGAGLGLAISQRIARAMQGDITVISKPGQGSTFTAEFVLDTAISNETISFPEISGEPAMSSHPAPTRRSLRGLRVLLAEDNDINALLATRLLEREGCIIQRARTGDEAVAAAARSFAGDTPPFDVILMDILMPRLDGVEAARAIRRLAHSIDGPAGRGPVIVAVTANAFAEDRQRYLAAGMDDYLAKPFDGRDLKDVLSRCLPATVTAKDPAA